MLTAQVKSLTENNEGRKHPNIRHQRMERLFHSFKIPEWNSSSGISKIKKL